jgi:hypothetical protein
MVEYKKQIIMKQHIIKLLLIVILVSSHASRLYAAGEIRKLKGIADSMDDGQEVLRQEGENYKKARAFIRSEDIKEGLNSDNIIDICGQPVAKADNAKRWVYKPPSSTFFKGEKIYFFFDDKGMLVDWQQL